VQVVEQVQQAASALHIYWAASQKELADFGAYSKGGGHAECF
jgi:hypothetical protein